MEYGKHVFISYAHLDNEGGPSTGWVSRFHRSLDSILSMRLGRQATIWRDERLKGNDDFAAEIVDQFPDTAVMISVVSPRYVESAWCLKEANTFCEVAKRPPGLKVDNKSRLFKIFKTPVDSQQALPEPMREVLGFDFYVRAKSDMTVSKDADDAPLELDPCYGTDMETRFNVAVARLAWDIAQTLRKLNDSKPDAAGNPKVPAPEQGAQPLAPGSPAAATRSDRPTVYLAECAQDRHQDREALRSELMMRGYPVLPERPLPLDEPVMRAEVKSLLERSALSIHLLGSRYGVVPDGASGQSVVLIQNELAVERARAGGLQRVVSLPAGTRSEDARQQSFIDSMHRDGETQLGADVITADLEALKSAVEGALERIMAPPVRAASEQADTAAGGVYVIFEQRDRKAAVPLRKALAARGVRVLTPVFEGDAQEVRRLNEERLTHCDAVVVFYGSGSEAWKVSVDADVRKHASRLLGGSTFTFLAEPATDHKNDILDMQEDPGLINGLSGFSDQLIAPIAAAAVAGASRA